MLIRLGKIKDNFSFFNISIITIILCLFSSQVSLAQTNLKQTNNQLSNVLNKIKQLKVDLVDTQASEQRLNNKLKRMDINVAKSASTLNKTQQKLADQQKSLLNLRQKQASLQTNLTQQRHALAQQLRQVYQLEKQDPIKMLLNQSDVNDISRTFIYYRYFNQARLQLIDKTRHTLMALHNNESAIQQQTHRLTELKQQQLTEKYKLDKQYKQQQQLLTTLQSKLRNKNQQLTKLDADKKALTQLIKKLQLASKNSKQHYFQQHRGKLPLPTSGQIITQFNDSLSAEHNIALRGIIIDAPTGQAVTAVAPGKVVFADWLRGMGLLLIIDHGDGYLSLYGHNQTLAKVAGDQVKQNDVIAYVGQSGGETTPGLYFAIRHNGVAVDPKRWLV